MDFYENIPIFDDIRQKMQLSFFVKIPHFTSKRKNTENALKSEISKLTKLWKFQEISDEILSSETGIIPECILSTWITDTIQEPWNLEKSITCDFPKYFTNRKICNISDSTISITVRGNA